MRIKISSTYMNEMPFTLIMNNVHNCSYCIVNILVISTKFCYETFLLLFPTVL